MCGEEVSVKEDDKEYWELVEEHRKRNKRLGYGDDRKNWERIKYENTIRKLKQETRIKRGIEKNKQKNLECKQKQKVKTDIITQMKKLDEKLSEIGEVKGIIKSKEWE